MAKVVTLGEIMLRLSPPGYQRFAQASDFEINYGGAEANVAASLAQFGNDAAFVSKIPANAIGDAAVATMKKLGVDCRHIVRGGKRLGIQFLENGASVRPSSVVYDRADSAITQALAEEFDFDTIFEGVDLFHVSGITPVLSDTAAELTMTALKKAKEHGVTVSFDLNYRAKLWTEDVEGKQKMLSDMMEYVDICFGNARDAAKCLGYTEEGIDFKGMKMVLIGTGGAATAIAVRGALDGIAEIEIFNIKDKFYSRGEEIVDLINKNTNCKATMNDLGDLDLLKEKMHAADLFCDATGVGMHPLEDLSNIPDPSFFKKDLIVTDTVYAPRETVMMKQAKEAGCEKVFNGMGMMLFQALIAIKLYTGKDTPVDYMKEKLGI